MFQTLEKKTGRVNGLGSTLTRTRGTAQKKVRRQSATAPAKAGGKRQGCPAGQPLWAAQQHRPTDKFKTRKPGD